MNNELICCNCLKEILIKKNEFLIDTENNIWCSAECVDTIGYGYATHSATELLEKLKEYEG